MMRKAAFAALLVLAACDTAPAVRPLTDPAVQSLVTLPLPEYAAKIRLARQIAVSCPRYAFDDRLLAQMSRARADAATGMLGEFRQRSGVALASDVEVRSFQARHGVEVGVSDLCEAADRELAEGTAISAPLIRL